MGLKTRTVATMLALATLWGCGLGVANRPPSRPDALIGAWRSRIEASSGALASIKDLEFMTVFKAGGTLTASSNHDGDPPVPPAYGVWRKTGLNTFEAQYTVWVAKPTRGYGVLSESITLAGDGRSYSSQLAYGFYDSAGKPAPGGGAATAVALKTGF
jgi:hypothetical protein